MSTPAVNARRGRLKAAVRPSAIRLLMHNRLAGFGLVTVALVVFLALLTPWLALPDPNATALADRLQGPFSPGHVLGTDHLGRDMLSRIFWGARVSLAVGVVATMVAAVVGSTLGLFAGFYGGRADNIVMRGIDMLMAFPYMLLALAIVAVLGPGLMNALFAIAVVNIPFFARSVRGAAIGLRRREFVDAARLSGLGNLSILGFEILPNVLPVIVITMSTTIGWMILETAGLSFLGLGAQPPQADLGSMLGDGRKLMITAPHVASIPGLAIFIIVMAMNLLGDGIRDVLDPRLKSGVFSRPAAATAVSRQERANAPIPSAGNALEVRDLSTHFVIGDQVYKAADRVDFSLKPGECLGIVGESGSGKSVAALSLMRLVASPPGAIVRGRVLFEGEDVIGLDERRLRALRGDRIAYVFQDPLSTLHPLYRIGDQIVEALLAHRPMPRAAARARAIDLFEMVQIPHAAGRIDAFPHQLSGGMRQRVGIAMALANRPDIIIADEPTTALDVTVQAEVLRILDALRRDEGASMVFITHDFGVIAEVCDRVIVMYAGQIVEEGPAADILARPLHPYTARLIACVPVLGQPDKAISAIAGLPPAVNGLPVGCAFAPRCERRREACDQEAVPYSDRGDGRKVRCIAPHGAVDGEAR